MIITRTLPPDTDEAVIREVEAHVRAELSAMAAADDDPETNADDVVVFVHLLAAGARDAVTGQVYEEACVLVVGELDMEPNAPYLKEGYDPYAGVAQELEALFRRDNPAAAKLLDTPGIWGEKGGRHVRSE